MHTEHAPHEYQFGTSIAAITAVYVPNWHIPIVTNGMALLNVLANSTTRDCRNKKGEAVSAGVFMVHTLPPVRCWSCVRQDPWYDHARSYSGV